MTGNELWRMSVTELAVAIGSRQVSSREVVEAHPRRIEAVNGSVNAVVVVMAEQALDAAERADQVAGSGGELPRLHGVPFTVKEAACRLYALDNKTTGPGANDLNRTPTSTRGVRGLGRCRRRAYREERTRSAESKV
jgi:hypothetical protein